MLKTFVIQDPPYLLATRPFARLRGPIGIVLLLEFTRIGINRFSGPQKRVGVGDALATVMGNSERFGRKDRETFGGQVKCRSYVLLSISSLKTFACLRTRRFAPAMPTPTSFSFAFSAYLTCPSFSFPNIPGPVIVDLKGFSITSGDGGISSTDELETCIDIGGLTPGVANLCPITIGNGTIKIWGFGVVAGVGSFTHPVYLTNITIQNIVFGLSGDESLNIQFFMVNSSTINNCHTFILPGRRYGIGDAWRSQFLNQNGTNLSLAERLPQLAGLLAIATPVTPAKLFMGALN